MTDDTPAMTGDELAGIVGLFGGLTRGELRQACTELIYRETGESPTEERMGEWIATALADVHLVETTATGDRLLVAGPTAFAQLPDGAENLPHLLDVSERSIDRAAVANDLLDDIAATDDDPDEEQVRELIDLTYDIESWAAVDASELRDRLDDR